MPDNNIIRVGTEVDLAAIQSGMPQAASLVEASTGRMLKSFDQIATLTKQGSAALLDWAGRPIQTAVAASEDLRKTVDISAESIKALAQAMKGTQHDTEETASGWEGFAERVKGFIQNPLEAAGDAAKEMLVKMGPIGGAVAATAGVMALMGKEAFDLVNEEGLAARQTQNFASMLGLGYEQTKKLGEMASLVDADIGGLARASFRLAEALEDPTGAGKEQADALRKLGINATDAGDALLQVLQKLSEIPNKTERINEAHVLLGRASFQLQPLIENYQKLSDTIEALGGQLSETAVKGLLDAREKVNELSIAWGHLKEAMASKVSGVVKIIVETAATIVAGNPDQTQSPIESQIAALKAAIEDEKHRTMGSDDKFAAGTYGANLKSQLAILEQQQKAQQDSKEHDKIIADGYAASAARWREAHAKTLAGMKDALEAADKQIKDSSAKLGSAIAPDQRAKETANLAKATADSGRLKSEIKAAEKADAGQSPEKKAEEEKRVGLLRVQVVEDTAKRKLALGLSTAAEEASQVRAAEATRYGVEMTAARKLGNDLEAVKLEHQRRMAEIDAKEQDAWLKARKERTELDEQQARIQAQVADQSAFGGKGLEAFQKLQKQIAEAQTRDAEQVAAIEEKAEISHASKLYEYKTQLLDSEVARHRMSVEQKIADLKKLQEAEYATQMTAAVGEYNAAVSEHGGNSPQAASAQAKIQEIADSNTIAMAKLNADAKKEMVTYQTTVTAALNTVTGAFDHAFENWTKGHKKFAASASESFRGMADTAISNIERMMAQMLVQFALSKALGQKSVMSKAYQSAANTWATVTDSGIGGIFNPIIAGAEAAGVFAAVAALGTFEFGGVVPSTGLKLVHEGERVLTQRDNQSFERAMGGGGGVQNHFHQAPGTSPNDVTAATQMFVRAMRDGRRFA